MRKVAILVSASPASATLARIAAISLALNRLDWQRWQASLHVFIDEEEGLDASRSWLRHLGGAVTMLGPAGQQGGL